MLVIDGRFFGGNGTGQEVSNTGKLSHCIDDYPEGIVIVADKPYRWTSADVIRKVKFAAIRHFGKKNLKVGHAGTLDPLATGVLIICIGNACKNAMSLQDSDKEYITDICFGATTPSYDLEKAIDRHLPMEGIDEAKVREALSKFVGEQQQIAPLFSAKQVEGVRAYDLARRMLAHGGSLDEAAQQLIRVAKIHISEAEVTAYGHSGAKGIVAPEGTPLEGGLADAKLEAAKGATGASSRINVATVPDGLPCARIRVACSKGTYIRALARDLGEALGSGAFLGSLRRTRCGTYNAPARIEQIINLFGTFGS